MSVNKRIADELRDNRYAVLFKFKDGTVGITGYKRRAWAERFVALISTRPYIATAKLYERK